MSDNKYNPTPTTKMRVYDTAKHGTLSYDKQNISRRDAIRQGLRTKKPVMVQANKDLALGS